MDDPGPIKLRLPPARYTTSTGAVRGSWCLQVHLASAFAWGVQRNVDKSRGAAVDSWFAHHRCIALRFSGFRGLDFLVVWFWRFLSLLGWFEVFLRVFVLPTPPRSVPGLV